MRHWELAAKVIAVLGLCSICFAGGNPEDAYRKPPTPPSVVHPEKKESLPRSGRADWVYESAGWVLNLYITHKGTDSGSYGILLYEGHAVEGDPGEVRALPIGTVQYRGKIKGNLQQGSGWQMKDPLVKPLVNTLPDTPEKDK